jgi:hypothetical protein
MMGAETVMDVDDEKGLVEKVENWQARRRLDVRRRSG